MRILPTRSRRDPVLDGLAAGRIVLGAAALLTPRALSGLLGVRPGPEATYLTRIFGGRAIALGAGYLSEPDRHRPRWHRLGLFVDVADTLAALAHLRRHDLPRPAVLALGALTGSYAVAGAVRLRSAPAGASCDPGPAVERGGQ